MTATYMGVMRMDASILSCWYGIPDFVPHPRSNECSTLLVSTASIGVRLMRTSVSKVLPMTYNRPVVISYTISIPRPYRSDFSL